MAQLTRDTLKYMGAVKDSALPKPDVIKQQADDLQQISNDLWSAIIKWRTDTEILKNAPLMDSYGTNVSDLFKTFVDTSNKFHDAEGELEDALRATAKQMPNKPDVQDQ